MPVVSVIMVFHRDHPFLRSAIASVLSQSYHDFELVLVDNGTALSAAALGDSGSDRRIRWVRLARNEGIPAGHNAGVAAATGEFIALQDYDDIAHPDRLQRQVAALRKDAGLSLVSALATRIDERNRQVGSVFCLPDEASHYRYSLYAGVVITAVAMGPRTVFQRWPYRSEFPLTADLDFQARLAEAGRMLVIPEVLLQYRWYPAQTTQSQATAIEKGRCLIQVITARRRSGRPENLPQAAAALEAATAAQAWRRGSLICLQDGHPVLAAYQARRSFALERTPKSAVMALRLAARCGRNCAGERRQIWKMFFTGPVRAFGLRPA